MEKSLREIAKALSKSMRCNCDLDNWQPEQNTGHSWVCRIHNASLAQVGLWPYRENPASSTT